MPTAELIKAIGGEYSLGWWNIHGVTHWARVLENGIRPSSLILTGLLWTATCQAQMPDPPGQVPAGETPKCEAYLFAHMMHGDYWRLYYSVSLDGLHWEILNGGKRVCEEYRGHASMTKGHDGRYYLVGNRGDDQPDINFWVSEIPSPNGKAWYLYYEQYPGVAYGLSVAASLEGPWFQAAGGQRPDWDKYRLPPKVRHGSMLAVTRKQYEALVAAFDKGQSN